MLCIVVVSELDGCRSLVSVIAEASGGAGKGAAQTQCRQAVGQGIDALGLGGGGVGIGPDDVEPGVDVRDCKFVEGRVGQGQGGQVVGMRDLRLPAVSMTLEARSWRHNR